MKAQPCLKNRRQPFAARAVFACCLVLCASAAPLLAQNGGTAERSSAAGGKWWAYESEDTMTAAKRVTFDLISENSRGSNREAQSRIDIYCENGKYKAGEFTPGVMLAPPNRPGFWGQPQMEVTVRVDSAHSNHGWNWNGRFLSMDKGTVRELLGSQVFKIEFLSPRGPQIAEFSPAGIDLERVSHACDLKPSKP